jgi:hypothetical protein
MNCVTEMGLDWEKPPIESHYVCAVASDGSTWCRVQRAGRRAEREGVGSLEEAILAVSRSGVDALRAVQHVRAVGRVPGRLDAQPRRRRHAAAVYGAVAGSSKRADRGLSDSTHLCALSTFRQWSCETFATSEQIGKIDAQSTSAQHRKPTPGVIHPRTAHDESSQRKTCPPAGRLTNVPPRKLQSSPAQASSHSLTPELMPEISEYGGCCPVHPVLTFVTGSSAAGEHVA